MELLTMLDWGTPHDCFLAQYLLWYFICNGYLLDKIIIKI